MAHSGCLRTSGLRSQLGRHSTKRARTVRASSATNYSQGGHGGFIQGPREFADVLRGLAS